MQKFLKMFIFIYIWLPLIPNNLLSKSLFVLLLGIMIFVLSLYTHRWVKMVLINSLVRTVLIISSILLFINFLDQFFLPIIEKWPSYKWIEQFLVMTIISIIVISLIVILIELLYKLVKNLVDPREVQGFIDKFEAYMTLAAAFLVPLLVPDLVFSSIYNLVLSSLHEIHLSGFESYYLSFVIHFALPLENRNLFNIIEIINSYPLLRFIQIVHVTLMKIIDLTIIAIVIGYINRLLK